MHVYILININPIEFAKKEQAKVLPFNVQNIDEARALKKIVKFKFNEKTAIIIQDIDKTPIEAINALLKNLEEPNENIIYILTASNINNVLSTIVSRCQVLQAMPTGREVKQVDYKTALNIKDRDEAIKFMEDLIYQDYNKNIFNNMENYLITIKNLKANGNVSLQLTNFVVTMNR